MESLVFVLFYFTVWGRNRSGSSSDDTLYRDDEGSGRQNQAVSRSSEESCYLKSASTRTCRGMCYRIMYRHSEYQTGQVAANLNDTVGYLVG